MTYRRGANALEFAILLPVFLAALTGILDYAWFFTVRNTAMSTARAGARSGAVVAPDGDPDGSALSAALGVWNGVGLPAQPTIVAFRTGTPQWITVRVTVPMVGAVGLVPGPSQIQVTAVERMEQQP